jgi:hypothetical protein
LIFRGRLDLPHIYLRRNKMGSIEVENESFLYDDFFTDENDRGVETIIEHDGRKLKFRVKKSLTLDEKQRATDAGVVITLDKDGNPKISKMDQAAYTRAVLLAGVKYWPFEYSPGKPVPITEKTVRRIDGTLADKVAGVILGQQNAQAQALDPFVQKSEEDSLEEEVPTRS